MRHQVFGRKLGRDTNARKALLNNLASAVIVSGKVNTTLAKAKFAKPYIEKLITSAAKNLLSKNRVLASRFSKDALNRLLTQVGPGFAKRPGGYTRIIKVARRVGDGAPMARLELLEIDKKTITESTSAVSSKPSGSSLIKKQSGHSRKSLPRRPAGAINQRKSNK